MFDEGVKKHRRLLEVAIRGTLSQSPAYRAALQRIREEGYDVQIQIKAKLGPIVPEEWDSTHEPSPQLELTPWDENFLRSMKIRPEL